MNVQSGVVTLDWRAARRDSYERTAALHRRAARAHEVAAQLSDRVGRKIAADVHRALAAERHAQAADVQRLMQRL
ncbi:MAG TPA: hypothetical protein VGQ20_01070 [Acidimicrobiales bacterium]|jgi:hypothetical protein|nr:hypothetical protein [Acidimicrobiales bacterium]